MVKRKLLFISSYDPDISEVNGVAKKLSLEIRTFQSFGYDVSFIEMNEKGVFINTNNKRKFCVDWNENHYTTFVNFYKEIINMEMAYDVIYLRYEHISFSMLRFLYKFKNSGKKIVIGELATFMGHPYSTSSLKTKISFYIKKTLNNYLPKPIDYLVTFSDHSKLFGLKTIKIENFTDVSSLEPKKFKTTSKDECHLLVLAQLTPAHGVDLLIKGMKLYWAKPHDTRCYLHVVGDGKILGGLKKLTTDLNMQHAVSFYGELGGNQLNEVFDICDVGVGALAIFRKGSYKLSELKLREYTARCLPFVYNAHEPQFENSHFCKKLEFEDKPTDISSIVEFYHEFDYGLESVNKMRGFADSNVTAEVQLKKVENVIENFFK